MACMVPSRRPPPQSASKASSSRTSSFACRAAAALLPPVLLNLAMASSAVMEPLTTAVTDSTISRPVWMAFMESTSLLALDIKPFRLFFWYSMSFDWNMIVVVTSIQILSPGRNTGMKILPVPPVTGYCSTSVVPSEYSVTRYCSMPVMAWDTLYRVLFDVFSRSIFTV